MLSPERLARALRILAVACAATFGGCAPSSDRQPGTNERAAKGPTTAAAAESTLARFLELSLATAKPDTAAISRVQQCYPDGEVEPLYVLADYRILGAVPHAETTYVRAEVATAAEGEEDADGWGVRAGARVDTAEWSIAPDSLHRRLIVCGIAHDGIDFQPIYSAAERNVHYVPSRAAVVALVDSLRRSRRHAP